MNARLAKVRSEFSHLPAALRTVFPSELRISFPTGGARTFGKVAGTGAQLVGLGAVEGMILPGVRIAQASPLVARDLVAMGGLGGTANVVGQGVDDAVRGQRSSLGDYAEEIGETNAA